VTTNEFRASGALTGGFREEVLKNEFFLAAVQSMDEDAPVNSPLGNGTSEGYLLGIERGYAMYRNRLLGLGRALRPIEQIEPDYGAEERLKKMKEQREMRGK
jgi:hypothetical protein